MCVIQIQESFPSSTCLLYKNHFEVSKCIRHGKRKTHGRNERHQHLAMKACFLHLCLEKHIYKSTSVTPGNFIHFLSRHTFNA